MGKARLLFEVCRQLEGQSVEEAVWVLTEALRLTVSSAQPNYAEDFIKSLQGMVDKHRASEAQTEPRQQQA